MNEQLVCYIMKRTDKNTNELEGLEKELKGIPDPPIETEIIETSHPKFPLGLVATDRNEEYYVLEQVNGEYKWRILAK